MMTSSEVDDFFEGVTFGAEMDISPADRRIQLPLGNRWCSEEIYGMTPCGISIDPELEFNMFGGELQAKPVDTPQELQSNILSICESVLPEYRLTNPGSIHAHVKIPKLFDRPDVLRYLLHWGQKWDRAIFKHVFNPTPLDLSIFPNKKQRNYYRFHDMTRRNWMTTPYIPEAIARVDAFESDDVKEIVFELHDRKEDFKVPFYPPHTYRPCVNYGHLYLKHTGTIEFRGFICTVNPNRMKNVFQLPLDYLRVALMNDSDPEKIVRGKDYYDYYGWGMLDEDNDIREHRANTCLYSNSRSQVKQYIHHMLLTKKITIADLNYPKYWVEKGFS